MNKKFIFLGPIVAILIIGFFFLPEFSQAISFENPIAATSFQGLLGQILGALQGLIAILAVIFIVVGGIMYMISAGNQGMMDKAKKIITAAVIGLVIALSANTFMVEIWRILQPASGTAPTGTGFQEIATRALQFLLSIVGVLGIIGMVIGGGMMLTAYGSEERVKKGKQILTYAILGVIVSLSALIIVTQITKLIV